MNAITVEEHTSYSKSLTCTFDMLWTFIWPGTAADDHFSALRNSLNKKTSKYENIFTACT